MKRERTQPAAKLPIALVLMAFAAGLSTTAALAQENPGVREAEAVNLDWYYAAAWGTGAYRAGDRSVYVFRVPAAWSLPEPESGKYTARLLLPVSVGLVDFDLPGTDGFDGLALDHVSSVLFTPGVEFTIPMGADWTLKPFATLGGGYAFDADESALIGSLGLQVERRLACRSWRCTLGGRLTWAGYRAEGGLSDGMAQLSLGLDAVSDMGPTMFGSRLDLGGYAVYRRYLESQDLLLFREGVEPLESEWEVGLTLNAREPWRVFGYSFDRIGLGFRFGRSLRGIRFVSTLPF